MTPKVAPKKTHSLQISISACSHHTSTNLSVILNGIFVPHSKAHWALLRLGATMLVSTLFVELGKEDVMVIQCGLSRNDDFNQLYVCFCHLQLRQLGNKLHTSDANHTLSSLLVHSATCFSHSHTSLGLQQSNMSLIKKGHWSISSSSILVHSSSLIISIAFMYVSATFSLDS